MVVGYRNSAGVDFDNLFQPGSTQAPGFRKSDGTNLRYAPRGTTTKIPNVGYRDDSGSDLSNLWMAKGLAPPVPGFDGKTYATSAQAPTGQTGNTSATLRLTMNANGTWQITSTRSGSFNNGTTTLDSGTWLPAGGSAADYTVRFAFTGGTGQGTTGNSAPTDSVLTTTRSASLEVSVPAASATDLSDNRGLTAVLTRVGGGSSTALCSISVSAVGYL